MKKSYYLFLSIFITVLFVTGCAGKTESKATDAENEETGAVTEDAPAPAPDDGSGQEALMQAPLVSTAKISSYSILRRAGASQSLFLEEDISALVEKAAQSAVSQEAGSSDDLMVPNGDTAEEEAEVSEEEQENTGEEEDTQEQPDTEDPAAEEPAPEETPEPAKPATGGGRVICIDAGHQGKQNSGKEPIGPGASETKMKVTSGTSGAATGVPEYQLTLAVAKKLQNVLQQRGYTVVMCRSSHDVDISNAERATVANNAGAAAFIRIHADGANSPSAAGGSTLAPSSANPYCASIAPQSQNLAKCVINSYCAKTGIKNRGVQITDSMTGLNWSQVPVTIIEMGFMTNPAEDQLMETEAFQQSAAEGIADGIDAFMQ